jgi:hypothetical protein
MAKLAEFMSADGLQHMLRVNLERVAYISDEAGADRLHFSALPGDFIDVLDFHGHLKGDDDA